MTDSASNQPNPASSKISNLNAEDFLLEEYRQIAQNIRNGWDYIFNFFRNFIIIQALIIAAVSTVIGFTLEYNESQEFSSNDSKTSEEYQKVNKYSEKEITIPLNKETLITGLSILGFLYSFGGLIHNIKIFKISEDFVARVSAIESYLRSHLKVSNLETSGNGESMQNIPIPHFQYMRNKIKESKSKPKWMIFYKTDLLIGIFYTIVGLAWVGYLAYILM